MVCVLLIIIYKKLQKELSCLFQKETTNFFMYFPFRLTDHKSTFLTLLGSKGSTFIIPTNQIVSSDYKNSKKKI